MPQRLRVLGVPEQRTKTRPIKAQSTAIAQAMARICNAERVRFGVVSGHERKTLSLSDAAEVFAALEVQRVFGQGMALAF